jgi:hypothetical protein
MTPLRRQEKASQARAPGKCAGARRENGRAQ